MGIKDFLLKRQIKTKTEFNDKLNKLADDVINKKAKELKKQGKPVTKESLMSGWSKPLELIGLTREMLGDKIDEYLSK